MIHFCQNKTNLGYSLNYFFNALGTSKQAYHQALNRSKRYQGEVFLLVDLIKEIRVNHPTMNCRDMYYKINPFYVGRDKFEAICRECGFSVKKHINYQRTTDSSGVVRFPNLLADSKMTEIDQAWSSDITYFEVEGIFYYITFIIDNYSRRIVGHHTSSRLSTEHTSLPAIKLAIKTRGGQLKEGIIFHSDGGGQYYDDNFLELTSHHKFANSMCEAAWENGKAERINGVIKNNYLRHWNIKGIGELVKNVDRAVKLYNEEKPHIGLGRLSPVEFEKKFSNLAEENKWKTKGSKDKKGQKLMVKHPQSTVDDKSPTYDIISKLG
jgi:putative transposase